MAVNTLKKRMRSWLGRKRIFGVFRAPRTCLVAANVVLLRWEDNNASSNPLAGFEGHFEFEVEKGRMKGNEGGEREERKV